MRRAQIGSWSLLACRSFHSELHASQDCLEGVACVPDAYSINMHLVLSDGTQVLRTSLAMPIAVGGGRHHTGPALKIFILYVAYISSPASASAISPNSRMLQRATAPAEMRTPSKRTWRPRCRSQICVRLGRAARLSITSLQLTISSDLAGPLPTEQVSVCPLGRGRIQIAFCRACRNAQIAMDLSVPLCVAHALCLACVRPGRAPTCW